MPYLPTYLSLLPTAVNHLTTARTLTITITLLVLTLLMH